MSNDEQYTDEDMANVGRALMTAIQEFMPEGWSPMDCPSEAIGDLCNEIDELKAELVELSRQAGKDTAHAAHYRKKFDQASGAIVAKDREIARLRQALSQIQMAYHSKDAVGGSKSYVMLKIAQEALSDQSDNEVAAILRQLSPAKENGN